jgi:hypothetical protein
MFFILFYICIYINIHSNTNIYSVQTGKKFVLEEYKWFILKKNSCQQCIPQHTLLWYVVCLLESEPPECSVLCQRKTKFVGNAAICPIIDTGTILCRLWSVKLRNVFPLFPNAYSVSCESVTAKTDWGLLDITARCVCHLIGPGLIPRVVMKLMTL